jgi:hypothetical protein
MGYKMLGSTELLMEGYLLMRGLEGPFTFNGRVLYYSASEGKYWDPKTDLFLPHAEITALVEKNIV